MFQQSQNKNELLCQFTANALNKKVLAGPIESTVLGNILMQAKANGPIKSLSDARKIVSKSIVTKEYKPAKFTIWEKQYNRFKEITKNN